jgi:hypothetical protein
MGRTEMTWMTNNAEAAKSLKAIDRRYAREIEKCNAWPLGLKIARHRKLKAERQEAYERVQRRTV